MNKQHKSPSPSLITQNRRALHDYFIEERFEAGILLEGWEVKSLRDNKVQINESYVILKDNAAWLLGAHFSPLKTASTHIHPDPTRTRKLLLTQRELNKLYGSVERKGYTLIPLSIYWKRNRAKVELALAKGKKEYDKRQTEKEKDWQRQKQKILRYR